MALPALSKSLDEQLIDPPDSLSDPTARSTSRMMWQDASGASRIKEIRKERRSLLLQLLGLVLHLQSQKRHQRACTLMLDGKQRRKVRLPLERLRNR